MLLCSETRSKPRFVSSLRSNANEHPNWSKTGKGSELAALDPSTGIRAKHPAPHENPGKPMRFYINRGPSAQVSSDTTQNLLRKRSSPWIQLNGRMGLYSPDILRQSRNLSKFHFHPHGIIKIGKDHWDHQVQPSTNTLWNPGEGTTQRWGRSSTGSTKELGIMKLYTIPPYGMTFPKQGMVLATALSSATTFPPESFPTPESMLLTPSPEENSRVFFATLGKKICILMKFVHIPRQGWAPGNTNPLIMYIDYGVWYLQPEWFALKRSHAPRDIQVFPFEYIVTNPILVLFQTWFILLRLC